ncbi:MAG TPA: GNAT family N-acetyltransferase [Verrucomicrobiae bacterium]|nr:GNAT family N-acetyltransferase [Verrucomicrobiae bacterium]
MSQSRDMVAGYEIHDGIAAMDFARVQVLLAATYWAEGIDRGRVERAAQNSALVIGAFAADGAQVGYARVVSDKTRFAYVCDVVVDEAHRDRGLGRAMVRFALEHPDFSTVTTWTLSTRDAHGVYGPLGFLPITEPASRPEDWMVLRRGRVIHAG